MVSDDTRQAMRRASLRRQVALLEHIRDTMMDEPDDDYEAFAIALTPLTDKLIRELMALEGVPPYPHPLTDRWWYEPVETPGRSE